MINVTLVGRLGRDAEKKSVNGKPLVNLSVASGRDDAVTWVSCGWWNPIEKLIPHLQKGRLVAVSGELSTTEKDGRTFVNVRVTRLELLGSKPEVKSENRKDSDDEIPF